MKHFLSAVVASFAMLLPGCASDERVGSSNWVSPPNICIGAVAPETMPTEFGAEGFQAQYSFSRSDAPKPALGEFLRVLSDAQFSFIAVPISINGVDTIFVPGRKALHADSDVKEEFRAACALSSHPKIYIYAVRYNRTTDQTDGVRVR